MMIALALGVLLVQAAIAERAPTRTIQETESGNSVCIAQYAPALCVAQYGGEEYKATGSNACTATHKLVHNINNAYAWFVEVREQDLANLTCTDMKSNSKEIPEHSSGNFNE